MAKLTLGTEIQPVNLGTVGRLALNHLKAQPKGFNFSKEVRLWAIGRAVKKGFKIPDTYVSDYADPPHKICPLCLKAPLVVAVKKHDTWKCPSCDFHSTRINWDHITPEFVESFRKLNGITPAEDVEK